MIIKMFTHSRHEVKTPDETKVGSFLFRDETPTTL